MINSPHKNYGAAWENRKLSLKYLCVLTTSNNPSTKRLTFRNHSITEWLRLEEIWRRSFGPTPCSSRDNQSRLPMFKQILNIFKDRCCTASLGSRCSCSVTLKVFHAIFPFFCILHIYGWLLFGLLFLFSVVWQYFFYVLFFFSVSFW